MLRLALAAAFVLVFALGYLTGQSDPAPTATAQSGSTFCEYSTSTRYLSGGGSYTILSAVVAQWSSFANQWRSVSSYTAQNAVASFSCRETY